MEPWFIKVTSMADPIIPESKWVLHDAELQRLSGSRLEAARLVLVEGLSRTEAGQRVGMSKQGVQQAIKKVLSIVSKKDEWVVVNTLAPKKLAEEFLAKIAELSENDKQS